MKDLISNIEINKVVWERLKNRDFVETRFCRVTPAQVIRYLKSFHKANLDVNKPLRL